MIKGRIKPQWLLVQVLITGQGMSADVPEAARFFTFDKVDTRGPLLPLHNQVLA